MPDVVVLPNILNLVPRNRNRLVPNTDGIDVQHVGERLGGKRVEGLDEQAVVDVRGQVQDRLLRVQNVLGGLRQSPGEDVEFVLALAGIGYEVALGFELLELVVLHLVCVVGFGVAVVEGEVVGAVETLVRVGSEFDASGGLSNDEHACVFADEIVEDFVREVGLAGVFDSVALFDAFEEVEELVPLVLREVLVVVVGIYCVRQVDDD